MVPEFPVATEHFRVPAGCSPFYPLMCFNSLVPIVPGPHPGALIWLIMMVVCSPSTEVVCFIGLKYWWSVILGPIDLLGGFLARLDSPEASGTSAPESTLGLISLWGGPPPCSLASLGLLFSTNINHRSALVEAQIGTVK